MLRKNTLKILLLLSLFVTGSAWAEWIKTSETDYAFFYIDPDTIRKEGNLRKAWSVIDYRKRDKNGYMSMRTRNEYDCENDRFRFLDLSHHFESMAKDTPAPFNVVFIWYDIPPNSGINTIFKIVCAK